MIKFIVENSPIIGTVGFTLAFVYIVFNTYRKKNKKKYEEDAKIPLKDED